MRTAMLIILLPALAIGREPPPKDATIVCVRSKKAAKNQSIEWIKYCSKKSNQNQTKEKQP
jgi:hypothetical protein